MVIKPYRINWKTMGISYHWIFVFDIISIKKHMQIDRATFILDDKYLSSSCNASESKLDGSLLTDSIDLFWNCNIRLYSINNSYALNTHTGIIYL